MFSQFDTDNDGYLNKDETREFYKVAVAAGGATFSEDHYETAFVLFDVKGNGAINLEVLTYWLIKKSQELGLIAQ